ncbi:DUF4377 domain-containing protein [Chryseobacterium herbae]|uniref:DUF4377 domain-containing protein n=1 Tax=Chryseobacterium herbae TaxID=2976476 RepID=A0ABT2IPQ3_9FLAO|nr:DUF4377 domain-containing protein [Chryseobacterium sp. pc1-10]MCT2560516.1 DUF4377 domain-containing protein [Chryseobacterium sp. pc1-10]
MKNFIIVINILFLSLLFVGCSKDDESSVREAEFDISSAYVECNVTFNSPASQKCLTVTESGHSNSYTIGQGTIAGFDYEPGYKYRVNLRLIKIANPPSDGSDTEYELIKVISKVKVD